MEAEIRVRDGEPRVGFGLVKSWKLDRCAEDGSHIEVNGLATLRLFVVRRVGHGVAGTI